MRRRRWLSQVVDMDNYAGFIIACHSRFIICISTFNHISLYQFLQYNCFILFPYLSEKIN